jgi:hypothetical protein
VSREDPVNGGPRDAGAAVDLALAKACVHVGTDHFIAPGSDGGLVGTPLLERLAGARRAAAVSRLSSVTYPASALAAPGSVFNFSVPEVKYCALIYVSSCVHLTMDARRNLY